MKPELLPNICFHTKLWNRKSNRYFIVDSMHWSNSEVEKVALLDLGTRTRIWRLKSEVHQLMLQGVLEEWTPAEDNYF